MSFGNKTKRLYIQRPQDKWTARWRKKLKSLSLSNKLWLPSDSLVTSRLNFAKVMQPWYSERILALLRIVVTSGAFVTAFWIDMQRPLHLPLTAPAKS